MKNREPVIKQIVIDNRIFLLGLDELYRNAIKPHERGELLECAQLVANTLGKGPADVPIEGYYTEDEQLSLYFRLMRTLQSVSSLERDKVSNLSAFHRLEEVTGSSLFGISKSDSGFLLPQMKDALYFALNATGPAWQVENLVNHAYIFARQNDDISLGGLAALSKDPVVLTALRESVVLYVAAALGLFTLPVTYQFEWKVDDFLAAQSARFITEFNLVFSENLPKPMPENAEIYWNASKSADILGRCVRLGFDDRFNPAKQYHWAIDRGISGDFIVKDFWSEKIWTTEMYREERDKPGGFLEIN